MPDVMLCFPLDYTSEVERGIVRNGQIKISIDIAQALRPGEATSVPLSQQQKQHRRQQFTSDKFRAYWRKLRHYGLFPMVGGII